MIIKNNKAKDCDFVVCAARFERATYALEALKMDLNNSRNNDLSLARSGVLCVPRSVALSGIHRFAYGTHKCGVS